MFITHLHPVLRLRIIGVMHTLPLYAFMANTGATLLYFYDRAKKSVYFNGGDELLVP